MPRMPRRALAVPAVLAASLSLAATTLVASNVSAADPDRADAERVYDAMTTSDGASQARGQSRDRARARDYVKLDLLALNDFHGNLETIDPVKSSSGRINQTPAGGAAYLGALLREERAKSRAAGATPITVAAGDLIGASPLVSAAFHDEPAVKAMNRVGLQVASVGNHEFDEGYRELLRMQRGGCLDDGPDGVDGQNSCPGDQGFPGAAFQYLGANVTYDAGRRAGDTVLPATKIMKVEGQKVAFIGMTLEGTASIVSQAGIQGISFRDEVETANALVPQLRARGAESIVVLLHEGVTPTDATAYNDCTGAAGPALEIAQQLKPAVDAVVSGHTHQPYNCVVKDPKGNNRLLTSAASFGRMVSKLHFLIDPRNGDIVRPAAFAENLIAENGPDVTPQQSVLDLIATYKELVKPIADEVLGHIEPGSTITRTADTNGGDSPAGNLIADAQRVFTTIAPEGTPAPVVSFMNPGGIRADLIENSAGDVTYGAAFEMQPFNNVMTSFDLTGAQIEQLLNEQWNGSNEAATSRKILQVSGLKYTWDLSDAGLPDTNAIVGDVLVDADGDPSTALVPLVDGDTYRVAASNFLADGGDNFATFKQATNRITEGLDIDALREYLVANDPVAPTATDRISQQP
ncbi:bifunctional metallophosphatase/5'-nucleotidase [Nocardioides sp. HDW12B]|uniref:bifunctional metallophosphatase/5'-nucleotidase n=1 Tax=Nocardioides sp. HDW12B TaxID=2714939 RepID=UPI00140D8220|nr:bifunctional metallophosphatase/5'-nucleotidase [Nocardioides sp. HDW12B]QIK67234.1 bifunctional metallophosphatase/5'-nucleotidase [Nocardioides sp. HDW12B]